MFRWIVIGSAIAQITLVSATNTMRSEHVVGCVLLMAVAFAPKRYLSIARSLYALWLAGSVFDAQRFFVAQWRGPIHTDDLWRLDRTLFPAFLDGIRTTWPAYFNAKSSVFMDVLCGGAYFVYLIEYFAVLGVLYWRRGAWAERMAWAFAAVNIIAVCMYMLYPAAPPWYIIMYGDGPARLDVPGNPAGTARFDAFFGIRFFQSFYGRNPNVFGAMPSMHVAYPVIAYYFSRFLGPRWQRGTGLYAILVGLSAVYLTHHYVLDVVVGSAVGLLTAYCIDQIFDAMSSRSQKVAR